MADRHTLEELNNCSREELITIVLMMQGQLDTIDGQLSFLMRQKTAALCLSRSLLRRKYFHSDVTIRKKEDYSATCWSYMC